jgi:DNA-binding MarR family transcriptional regulator
MSPEDRRVVLAAITDDGRALAEAATSALNDAGFGLPGLSQGQAAEITEMLRTVRAAVGDVAPDAVAAAGDENRGLVG